MLPLKLQKEKTTNYKSIEITDDMVESLNKSHVVYPKTMS